jgi:hypothetical protein
MVDFSYRDEAMRWLGRSDNARSRLRCRHAPRRGRHSSGAEYLDQRHLDYASFDDLPLH